MQIALCNEVIRDLEFAAQCRFAAQLGYDALEIAPFTLGEEPHLLPAGVRKQLREAAADAGLEIVSLHWLLVAPTGLSITSADADVRTRTVDVMRRLVDVCADLGGKIMVHGSPAQRQVQVHDDMAAAWDRARDCWAAVAATSEARGVTYCIEPLSRNETGFINTVMQAVRMVEEIGSPAIRTMIDTSAAGATEELSVPDLIDRWMPTGMIAHVQVNDTNRRGPGQGSDHFAPIFAALERQGYDGAVAVEPFDYVPDGQASAARAIGYVRGILEALSWQQLRNLPE